MPRLPKISLRATPDVVDKLDARAREDGTTRSQAALKLIDLGLDRLRPENQTLHDAIDAALERVEGLNDRLTSVETGLTNTMTKAFDELYSRQLALLENLVAWEVEALMLLRASIGSRTPELVTEAQNHAREFLHKKYALLDRTAPGRSAPAKRA